MKQYKPRDKITQKMTRDGLTEQNQTTGESERISKRIQEADFQKTPEQQAAQDAAQLQGAASPLSPLKSYFGTGLFAIFIHPITFYCSSFLLDMSTYFLLCAKIFLIIHGLFIAFVRLSAYNID